MAYQRLGENLPYNQPNTQFAVPTSNFDASGTSVGANWGTGVFSDGEGRAWSFSSWTMCIILTAVIGILVLAIVGIVVLVFWTNVNTTVIEPHPHKPCVNMVRRVQGGSWVEEWVPNGQVCQSPCVDGSGACLDGECVGTCMGQCLSIFDFNPPDEECPPVMWTTPVENSGVIKFDLCFFKKCIWFLEWDIVPEYPCLGFDHGRHELKERAARHCMDAISDNDPRKPCMTALATCFLNFAVCIFDYECGRYLALGTDAQCAAVESENFAEIAPANTYKNTYSLSSKFSWQSQRDTDASVSGRPQRKNDVDSKTIETISSDVATVDLMAVRAQVIDELDGKTMLDFMEAEFLRQKGIVKGA